MNNLFFSNLPHYLKESSLEEYSQRVIPSYNEKRNNLNNIKNNTFKSLYEVEYFLNSLCRFTNCIKLYKILK